MRGCTAVRNVLKRNCSVTHVFDEDLYADIEIFIKIVIRDLTNLFIKYETASWIRCVVDCRKSLIKPVL